MKHTTGFALALALLCASPALGNDPYSETPLMIIRFNQPRVDYPRPLYDTLSRALAVKPDATFSVVTVAPRAEDNASQSHNNAIAEQNTNKVLATMRQIGMPERRIHTSTTTDMVDASEVRIYVH